MRVVEKLIQSNRITASDVAEIFGISRQAASKELNKLVEVGVIKLVGERKGAHYVLV